MTIEADILRKYRTVAVVGLSASPERPSYRVAAYLKEQGYRVIPVNPREQQVLGEKCYPDLCSIPEPVEVVDIFRGRGTCHGWWRRRSIPARRRSGCNRG